MPVSYIILWRNISWKDEDTGVIKALLLINPSIIFDFLKSLIKFFCDKFKETVFISDNFSVKGKSIVFKKFWLIIDKFSSLANKFELTKWMGIFQNV